MSEIPFLCPGCEYTTYPHMAGFAAEDGVEFVVTCEVCGKRWSVQVEVVPVEPLEEVAHE
jgi:hypothetical protein